MVRNPVRRYAVPQLIGSAVSSSLAARDFEPLLHGINFMRRKPAVYS